MVFQFVQPQTLLITFPLIALAYWLHKRRPVMRYRYPLTDMFVRTGATASVVYKKMFLHLLRLIALIGLALLLARPSWFDDRRKTMVEGIDIMLVLDVSGSMENRDFSDDKRSRFEVAKDEAIRFVQRRVNDSIGLVIFGGDVLTRCPITTDNRMVLDVLKKLSLGEIDDTKTMLATAMLAGVNRLKKSKATSKIMVLLTDGIPSEGENEIATALTIAQKFGIKIYVIGIGSDEGQLGYHPLYGWVQIGVNKDLLSKIASKTNGQFFMAQNAHDMRTIYDTIDALEKSSLEQPVYTQGHDFFVPFVFAIMAFLIVELMMTTLVWFGIY